MVSMSELRCRRSCSWLERSRFWRGLAAMFPIQALHTWKQEYMPGSLRDSAKYCAVMLVVVIVMMIPVMAATVGAMMWSGVI